MNPITDFIEENCVLRPAARAIAADVTKAYQVWAKSNGKEPLSGKRLMERLRGLGCQTGVPMAMNGTTRRCVVGLGLVSSEGDEDVLTAMALPEPVTSYAGRKLAI